jgi:hypothetical protein
MSDALFRRVSDAFEDEDSSTLSQHIDGQSLGTWIHSDDLKVSFQRLLLLLAPIVHLAKRRHFEPEVRAILETEFQQNAYASQARAQEIAARLQEPVPVSGLRLVLPSILQLRHCQNNAERDTVDPSRSTIVIISPSFYNIEDTGLVQEAPR